MADSEGQPREPLLRDLTDAQSACLTVIGDIHTHPGVARQSSSDRTNPMVATPGHLAIIVPRLAQPSFKWPELGIYEYLGQHRWHEHSGAVAGRFFYVGLWG